jgi:hypothetical protein
MEKDVPRISSYFISFVLALLFTSSFIFGQDLQKEITVPFKKVSLKTLLDYINKEGKIEFSYVTETLPLDSTIVISESNISLARLLNETFSKLNLEYEAISGTIVIRKKDLLRSKYLTVSTELEGVVLDSETEKPLALASVYFSNTSCGTYTNQLGFFRIKDPPKNAKTIVISHLGYKTLIQHLNYKIGTRTRFLIKLNPLVTELEEVNVNGKRDKRWLNNFEAFKKEFLGGTPYADLCTFLNPEVLRFKKGEDQLKIESIAPLKIRNQALGYQLQIELQNCIVSNTDYSFLIHTKYDTLAPENYREKVRWETNRLTSYLGSETHLFKSIVNKDLWGEGFEIYKQNAKNEVFLTDTHLVFQSDYSTPLTNLDSLMKESQGNNYEVLKKGQYLIEYTKQVLPKRKRFISEIPFASSLIQIRSPSIIVASDGSIDKKSNYSREGWMDRLRIAALTPTNFEPEKSIEVIKGFYNAIRDTVHGVLINESTQRPIAGAEVFINYSTNHVKTGTDGKFMFKNIPNGSYNIVAEHKGMVASKKISTNLEQIDTLFLKVRTEPIIDNLTNADRKKYIDEFRRILINQGCWNDLGIENEQALDIYRVNNKTRYSSKTPIEIVSKSFGYRFKLFLQQTDIFKGVALNDKEIRGLGYFENLDTLFKNGIVDENRLEEYDQSLLHFSRSLLSGRYHEEGFQITTAKNEDNFKTVISDYSASTNTVTSSKPFVVEFQTGRELRSSTFNVNDKPFSISGYGLASAFESHITITGQFGKILPFPRLPLNYLPVGEPLTGITN